jgi:hypothetical protein
MATDFGSAFTGVGGLIQAGAGIAGGFAQAGFARQEAAIQTQEIQTQLEAENVRRTAMEISARRQQTENVRNAQMARSLALTTGASQGAQFGSGVAAGMGQASAQGAYANLGISQNLQLGERMFDINARLDAEKIAMAQTEGKAAESKAIFGGLGAFGGDLGSIYKGVSGFQSWLFPSG